MVVNTMMHCLYQCKFGGMAGQGMLGALGECWPPDDGLALLVGGILDGWLTRFGEEFFIAFFMLGFLDLFAGEEEKPVVTEIEVEDHFTPWTEDLRDACVFDAPVRFLHRLSHVGKESVALFALVGIFDVVTKLKGMIKVEFHCPDDEFCQIIQRKIPIKCQLGAEILMLEAEMVFLHGRKKSRTSVSQRE